MQRRRQREKECEQAGLEGDQAPDGVAPRQPAMKVPPAAPVDAASQQQRNDDPGIERPRLSEAGAELGKFFSISNCGPWLMTLNAGVLEYWSIGVLGFKCITPLLHSLQYSAQSILSRQASQEAAESRAAGTFAGRKVCMKATRAVTSCGARFLPKAGMLPPP